MISTDPFEEQTGGRTMRVFVARDFRTRPGFRFSVVVTPAVGSGPCEQAHFELKPIEDTEAQLEPGFALSEASTQDLMDELWRLGIRPTKGTARGEVEAAQQKHLDDLRTIAFHAIALKDVT